MRPKSANDRQREARTALTRQPGEHSWKLASRRVGMSLTGIALALVALLVIYRETEGRRLDFVPDLKGYRGEQMVADLLAMLEPLGFRVIHGLEFTDESGHKGNIDHTVVGPTGVFAIETKNWEGRMWKADGERLIHNGVDETGSVLQALAEAKELRRRLEAGHVPVRWVEALLVSAKSTLPDVRVQFRYVTLAGASDLVPLIRDRQRILSDSEVASALTALA